jgi:F-type H+-transporting ATPase subunit c
MVSLAELFHYGTVTLSVSITALGVGLGEGLASIAIFKALNIQPQARSDIIRTAILGMALIETAAIMGITMALVVLLGSPASTPTLYTGIAEMGIVCAICLSGFVLGIVSALPVQQACLSIARQPFFGQKITRFMLITQSIIQTPIIFGFVIAMYIKDAALSITDLYESIRLLACGISIGLGSIGPALGLAHFAKTACMSIGLNRDAYNKLLTFTLVSEAIIETPIIFSMVVALLLTSLTSNTFVGCIGMLAASLSIGFGTLGTGISSGRTAAQACYQIALNPAQSGLLSRVSMFAQGLMDTIAIYALLISIAILFY